MSPTNDLPKCGLNKKMVCGVIARENVEQNGWVAKLVNELGDSPPQPQVLDSRAFEQYQNHENAPSRNGLQSSSHPNKSACGWSLEGVCGAGLLNSCMKEEGGKIGYDELASTAKRQYYFLTKGDSEEINIAHILQKILEKRVPDLGNSGLPSIGSVLHDDGICKPCVFANKNNKNCRNGEACLFCHHDHKEKRRRSKRSKTSPVDTSMLPNQEAAAIGFRSRFFQSRTQDQLVAGGLTVSSCKGGWASSFTPTPSCLKNEQQETGLEAMLSRVSIDDLSSLPAPRCQFTEQGQGMGVYQQQQHVIGTALPSRSAWSTSWSFSTPQTSEPTRRAASSNAEVWRETNGSFSPEPLGQRASSAPSSSQGNASMNVSNHTDNGHHYCSLPVVNTPGHPITSNCAQSHQPATIDMNIESLLNFLSDSPPHAQSPNLLADHLQADARSVPVLAHSALGASTFSSCEREAGYNGGINASGGFLVPNQDFPDSSFWRSRVTDPEMFAQETLPMPNCQAAAREPTYWPAGFGGIGGTATGGEEPFLWDHCGSHVSYDFPDLSAKAFGVPADGGSLDPTHLGPIVGGNGRNSITNQAGDGQFNFQNVNSFGDPPLPIHENLRPLGSGRFGINHDTPEEIASFSHLLKNIIEGFGIPARPVQAGEDQRPVGPIKSPGRVE
eukprot:GHVN01011066.1.p1 GENE.GHVN01011066.1~~GHVN01011066.1.p1  ORF type:complete len:670 (-),score=62.15 GHVN01011066.1:558-2567(-)